MQQAKNNICISLLEVVDVLKNDKCARGVLQDFQEDEEPMSLAIIEEKINSYLYAGAQMFFDDILLMQENVRKRHGPNSPATGRVKKLVEKAQRELGKKFPTSALTASG